MNDPENAKMNAKLISDLYACAEANGLKLDDLAEKLDIGRSTMYRRIEFPGSFKLDEIRRLKRLFPGIEVE